MQGYTEQAGASDAKLAARASGGQLYHASRFVGVCVIYLSIIYPSVIYLYLVGQLGEALYTSQYTCLHVPEAAIRSLSSIAIFMFLDSVSHWTCSSPVG